MIKLTKFDMFEHNAAHVTTQLVFQENFCYIKNKLLDHSVMTKVELLAQQMSSSLVFNSGATVTRCECCISMFKAALQEHMPCAQHFTDL